MDASTQTSTITMSPAAAADGVPPAAADGVPPPAADRATPTPPPPPTLRYGSVVSVQPSAATAAVSSLFRGGLSITNETSVPLLVILSQLSPLHWSKVEPGETWVAKTGRVWFTVSACVWDGEAPSEVGVGLRLGAVLASTAVFPPLGVLAAVVAGITSTARGGAQMTGVYANRKSLCVRGGAVGTAYVLQLVVAEKRSS